MESIVALLAILFLSSIFALAKFANYLISQSNKNNRKLSIEIVQQFVPGNSSTTLMELIQYHKENGIINYKVINDD